MQTLVLDFETYYDAHYSLKKMPTLLYIRDPQFKVHGAAAKVGNQPSQWITASALPAFMAGTPWHSTAAISHNANFDMTILWEKYGVQPAQYIDTLALCRALLSSDLDFDLGSIAPLLDLGDKGTTLENTKGIRDLDPELEDELAIYACQDSDLEYGIYETLWPSLPECERRFMNLCVRMSCVGTLEFDREMGAIALAELEQDRERKISALGVTATQLRSAESFANLLRARGVEPPMKISAKTGLPAYAFSKQDPGFVELIENPDVADLMAARMVANSNNAPTRIKNLIKITSREPHTLPVQLNMSGAHTHRISGGGGINMQNLNNKTALRKAIHAPKDHVIVVADSSQIELRLNMTFSGQTNVVELLRGGGCPYVAEATRQFRLAPGLTKKTCPKPMRQYGKVVQLACGYGMGWQKFRATCAIGPMGNDPIYISDEEAKSTIDMYRTGHLMIKNSWYYFDSMLISMSDRNCPDKENGPLVIGYEHITLPGGLQLQYPNLRYIPKGQDEEDGHWVFGIGVDHPIWGGTVQENVIQALAGMAIREQMLAIEDELDGVGHVVHQVHDEILTVCHERDADDVLKLMLDVMHRPPSWMPDLPIAAEGGYDWRYTK